MSTVTSLPILVITCFKYNFNYVTMLIYYDMSPKLCHNNSYFYYVIDQPSMIIRYNHVFINSLFFNDKSMIE